MDDVPLELLYPVLDHLDRRDLVNTALVSKKFNRVTTPLLYKTLDSRLSEEKVLFHPCTTLLRRPELAQYVQNVTETGTVQLLRRVNPQIIKDIIAALQLCTNLAVARYIDDTDTPARNFLPILQVLMVLPLRELVIRTRNDVGEEAWALLNKMKGIRRLSVWSLDSGPPRVLQGWADQLSPTLTHLELGRCAGVPPTILISVFMKLPLLRELKLKGVPSAAIPAIMGCLPNLIALDVEYLGSGNYRAPSTLPALEHLTVQTRSIDILGPDKLWSWTRSLLPHIGSLKSFTLNSFSIHGRMLIPWPFVVFLATKQGKSLKELTIRLAMLSLDALSQLCHNCPVLEEICCLVASPDVESIAKAISSGNALRTLNLDVAWVEDSVAGPLASDICLDFSEGEPQPAPRYLRPVSTTRVVTFTAEEARSMMLRQGSKLRAVRLGEFAYTGQWVLAGVEMDQSDEVRDGHMAFEVTRDLTRSAL